MSWSVGYDDNWKRDIGYGVPSICDQPECDAKIDRGLSHVCGSEPFGGEHGCGLYFCEQHRGYVDVAGSHDETVSVELCDRCEERSEGATVEPYEKKSDTREWMQWKLSDDSWAQWRVEYPDDVTRLEQELTEALSTEITSFTCPPRCNAGGTEDEGGHVFDLNRDFIHCNECGADYTIEAGTFHDTRQLRSVSCEKCKFVGALTSNGGSLFCRCGTSAMDWTLMRPTPARNEKLFTCPHCEYDEAEGGLINQCNACKRKNAAQGSLAVADEWHDVLVTNDGAVGDCCDAGCNGRVYLQAEVK